jgi:hypothetical protein
MCLLSREGLSKALPQTSQGRRVLSPLGGRALGEAIGPRLTSSTPDEDSPEEMDFLSLSVSPGGEGIRARDRSDMLKSSGESEI